MFSGIRVIKAYALERKTEKEMAELAEDSKTKSLRLAGVNSLFGPLMITLIGISNLVVIFFGGMMYIQGDPNIKEIGVIAEFILYVNMLTWPVASIGWVSSLVQEAEASQKRINEILQSEPEIRNTQPDQTPIQVKIVFDQVSFTYPDTQIQALKDVSFTLEQGKTLAILGKTGSGKSKILALLTRLYDTT